MKKRFNILTIGCKANQYESQAFSDQLKTLGLILANKDDNADICIVNACSVTSSADKKSIDAIKYFKKKNKNAKFYFTGCISKDVKSKLDDDIIIIPNTQKESLVSEIFPNRIVPKFRIKNFDNHTRAFVKIQDGCDSYCSYCIIPFTRGRSRSRKAEDILNEILKLSDNGYKEIVLTGINLGEYASDISFADLLKEIHKIEDIKRIKLSSIHPQDITDELIDILINFEKMSKYLHISLQSGSNKILKKMRRKYTTEIFLEKVKKLTSLNPDFTFMTDLIVGFPSETNEDVEDTIKIIKEAEFTKVHLFPYSKRPDTLAAKFLDQVDKSVVDERKRKLSFIANEIAYKKREKFINREMKVLLENIKDDYFVGSTLNNLIVNVPKCEKISSNDILNVKLVKNMRRYILGDLCK
ncbi:MAG: Threonylcarbamoyladenosine tRNA methylthiotransferase MtaB [Candidatus Anoxychlamydiales bacterium]|nr:Threonylcarbamoyladenosine tRNA methylthiotransferase MtaB [Candidatus Anoxychlamydiales bacterium]